MQQNAIWSPFDSLDIFWRIKSKKNNNNKTKTPTSVHTMYYYMYRHILSMIRTLHNTTVYALSAALKKKHVQP